jgi:DMSO/TMAO reductase YedYZ heme-binding membrane subunit
MTRGYRGLGIFGLALGTHRLAYLGVLVVVQHLLLSPFASRQLVLALAAVVAVLLLARLVPART